MTSFLAAATGCTETIAASVGAVLANAMQANQVNTPLREAHFLSQCAHESALFTRTEENLRYSAQGLALTWPKRFYMRPDDPRGRLDALAYDRNAVRIANTVYADRMGNGNVDSGDGWRFRGRGFIQLTGKINYAAFARDNPRCDCLTSPDLLTTVGGASMSAAWFWRVNGCNALADADNALAISIKINGQNPPVGLVERMNLLKRARGVLGI